MSTPSTLVNRLIVGTAAAAVIASCGFTLAPAHAVPEIPAQPVVAQTTVLPTKAPTNSVSFSGKYCPKYKTGGSSYDRKVTIPRSKKNGTLLCDMITTKTYLHVTVSNKIRLYKANDFRLKVVFSLTQYKQTSVGDWTFYASADSVKLTGYDRYSFDSTPPAKKTYGSVKGNPFTASSRFNFCQVFDYPEGPKLDGCWAKSITIRFKEVKSVK